MLKIDFNTIYLLLQALLCCTLTVCHAEPSKPKPQVGLPLLYYREPHLINFGDYLSLKIVERIVGEKVVVYPRVFGIPPNPGEKKLLAIGSIFSFARTNDVIWGSGINGKISNKKDYLFSQLDIRAVRGPLTRHYLMYELGIPCPEIYGDPALLIPYLFPEFKKKENPSLDYLIIPHYADMKYFPKTKYQNVIYPTEPWDRIINKIVDSKFVISSSLHGIIVAEAFGIPAKLLRVSETEKIFKFHDYYYGTGRYDFSYATSVEEALMKGGEKPINCDLKKLYESFPFEFWGEKKPKKINFKATKSNANK